MKSKTILESIQALQEERSALWARSSRLGETERGRLLDIADELESLWNKRRIEKAGADIEAMPDVLIYAEPHREHRRGRAKNHGSRRREDYVSEW